MADRPCESLPVGEAAGLSNLGLRLYRVEPGEQIPLAHHYHDEQEEAFYVVRGTLYAATPEEEFVVRAGELFVAEPDSPYRMFVPEEVPEDPENSETSESAEVLAVGAPSVDDIHAYEP